MDQLYEAMPIPSFSDEDEGNAAHPQQPNDSGAPSFGEMDLDVSAHGSSSSFSSSTDSQQSSEDEAADEAGVASSRSHHRVFSSTSSPEELYDFLAELLHVAEGLLRRLQNALGGSTESFNNDGDTASVQVSRGAQTAEHSEARRIPQNNSATCHGAAKLRSRLRNEAECVRRAVEGLRSAGCTGVSTSINSSDATTLSIPPSVLSAAVACAQCNSLAHFEAVVACLEWEVDVTGVYVPISGHVGPPQRRSLRVAPGMSAAAAAATAATFPDHIRIEVDVVSSSGHRWIKVKTATPRSLAVEAAVLEMSGSTPFTDMLVALCERAGRSCLPHRRAAHVSVVFLHTPPLPLQSFMAAHRITWARVTVRPLRALSSGQTEQRCAQQLRGAWLPPLEFPTRLICLDTTALVTLCSQSCYVDAMSVEVRLERLAAFHVLREQQRKEAAETAAVSTVMEPALRAHTRWCTRSALNEGMRDAMLREDETPDNTLQTSTTNPTSARASVVPDSLLLDVDVTWLKALEQTTQALSMDAGHEMSSPVHESPLLCEYSARCAAEDAAERRRPNWIIADVTFDEFRWILETIAGPEEVVRAVRLLALVTVVRTDFLRDRMKGERDASLSAAAATNLSDAPSPAAAAAESTTSLSALTECRSPSPACATAPSPLLTSVEYLRLSGKVSLRNKVVFGLADAVDAIIVTSNEQLCHAAREQGVVLAAAFHPSRSLTEQKMYALRRRPGPGKPPAV